MYAQTHIATSNGRQASDEYGELLASNNKNKFFSIYFCKNKPTAPIEICKRKNYSK